MIKIYHGGVYYNEDDVNISIDSNYQNVDYMNGENIIGMILIIKRIM